MTDESAISTETGILLPEDARRIVADAARVYFASRRSRVDAFVARHFPLAGSVALHRKALDGDMLKAPANIALAVPQLVTKLAAAGANAAGAERASAFLGSRKLMFETAVGREIEWLIITNLLELPFHQGKREARRDALAEETCPPGASGKAERDPEGSWTAWRRPGLPRPAGSGPGDLHRHPGGGR